MHINDLAAKIKEGVKKAGLVGYQFNTIGVSDAMPMGTAGMSFSLPSRDIIADSIETVSLFYFLDAVNRILIQCAKKLQLFKVMSALWYDANVSIPGCDKNMPGCMMAIARLNRPAIVVYGGTMKKGRGTLGACANREIDIANALECNGEYISGKITADERKDIIRHACPGAGACGGM